MTARNAASSGREVMATGRPPTASVGDLAIEMPWSRAAASRVLLRSKAVTAYPALATSADIGKPILPTPIQAMLLEVAVIVIAVLLSPLDFGAQRGEAPYHAYPA